MYTSSKACVLYDCLHAASVLGYQAFLRISAHNKKLWYSFSDIYVWERLLVICLVPRLLGGEG